MAPEGTQSSDHTPGIELGTQVYTQTGLSSRQPEAGTLGENVFTRISYDIMIWEQIRYPVEWTTRRLVQDINAEISSDRSLSELQGQYPVPWQLREVMQQRADSWVQRLYDPCCDVYKRSGKELSAEFDRAVWAYCIEPFIMRETQTNEYGYRASILLELLLCAVGSPSGNRNL